MLLLWLACAGGPPLLAPLPDLAPFTDRTGAPCALVPTRGYGGDLGRWRLGGADGDEDGRLFVAESDGRRTWVLALDAAGDEIGRGELRGLESVAAVRRAGVHLFVVDGGRPQKVRVVDATDPADLVPLGVLDLGPGEPATTFVAWGDRVFTDGGDAGYLSMGEEPEVHPGEALAAPLVIGDELLGSLRFDDDCSLVIADPAGEPPAPIGSIAAGEACLSAGLVALADGSFVGVGTLGGRVVVQRFTRADDGWRGSAQLTLDLDEATGVVAVGDAVWIAGTGGPRGTAGVVVVRGAVPAVAATWWPDGLAAAALAVSAGEGWVGAVTGDGAQGVVALAEGDGC